MQTQIAEHPSEVVIQFPEPHTAQEPFFYWSQDHPEAQVLVAPCGTKLGKSFGCALWLAKEALVNPGSYCVWVGPTLRKCRIGYRYIKAMMPDVVEWVNPIDGKLEIRLVNGSYITFVHGRDAEVTVEGEGIDRFVIDESGKLKAQVWYSILTTITQTEGLGICTGTPRGVNHWYYKVFKQAQAGDPFFSWVTLRTAESPYVKPKAIEQAKRLLPPYLYQQYYEATFISHGAVFGDLTPMWDMSLKIEGKPRFWVHPDESQRHDDVCHGIDVAKKNDSTVFYSTNTRGKLVGFAKFTNVPYPRQVQRVKEYIERFFKGDSTIRYDATGVGIAFGDLLVEAEIDASIMPVTFTNRSKSEMVTKTISAIQTGWHKAPRIPSIETEFSTYELEVLKSGVHRYGAPDGGHDDIVSAGMLSISGAYSSALSESVEKAVAELIDGKLNEDDHLAAYATVATDYDSDDDFFESENDLEDDDFEFDEDID